MGKIKIRTLGDESLENKQKEQSKQKNKEKKLVKGGKGADERSDGARLLDKRGRERIVAVEPSEKEFQAALESEKKQSQTEKPATAKSKSEIRKTKFEKRKNPHSQSYLTVAKILDKSKKYALNEALVLLEKLKRSKFDETVELHVNTVETGISGNITLPHGTGKVIKVAIADDDLLAKVAAGKIDFDILLADLSMMPKLARVAKILGPKGLMPNPKNATLVKDPAKAAENFKQGQVYFKTEAKAPILHLVVGKLSFGAKKLAENIEVLIEAIKKEKILNVTLKSTMSPGIKIQI